MAYLDPDSNLREGYTIRGLPLIPPASLLAEFPILADRSRYPSEGSLVVRVRDAITEYNHLLKLVAQPGGPEQWKASADVVEQTMNINEVVQRAHAELSELTLELKERVDRFNGTVVFRESHFRDGSRTSLPPELMQEKLEAYTIPDPETFVQDIRHSLQKPGLYRRVADQVRLPAHDSKHLPSMIRCFVEKLLMLEDGHRLAFELCFAIKLDSSMVKYEPCGRMGLDSSGFSRNEELENYIVRLQQGFWISLWPGEALPDEQRLGQNEIEPAAARRRLWASMETKGCQALNGDSLCTYFDTQGEGYRVTLPLKNCWCHRRTSLWLLRELQRKAYGRIRSTVMLTLGQLVPADVCELLFEFAMAAEEIPLDPRVCEPDFHEDAERWLRAKSATTMSYYGKPFQQFLRREYRCPQYQQGIGAEESRVGAQETDSESNGLVQTARGLVPTNGGSPRS